jgi:hypothetical protein
VAPWPAAASCCAKSASCAFAPAFRVRFARSAYGVQKPKLVLTLEDGRGATRPSVVVLCAPGA